MKYDVIFTTFYFIQFFPLIFTGQPTRTLPNSSSNFVRSSSYESVHRMIEDDERKRQANLRNRACNDSFRQAVDKSYRQNKSDGNYVV